MAEVLPSTQETRCSSSESEFNDDNTEDLSSCSLRDIPSFAVENSNNIYVLHLNDNLFHALPGDIEKFTNLVMLDISNNNMKDISPSLCCLTKLKTLVAKNNLYNASSIPKDFGLLHSLEVLNLSSNRFTTLPPQLTELSSLRCLYLGGNQLQTLPPTVKYMQKLEVFYLGGNILTEIPTEVGHLQRLSSLMLCNNRLTSIPESIANLHSLRALSLHNNDLSTLPHKIVSLNLVELSLRNNPLVTRFVASMTFDTPSLLELAGRAVLTENIPFGAGDLPRTLIDYLKCAHKCVNSKCKGVFFSSRVEHVKFVDFCGKYRIPLMEYLCSPTCSSQNPQVRRECAEDEVAKMKKVLLG